MARAAPPGWLHLALFVGLAIVLFFLIRFVFHVAWKLAVLVVTAFLAVVLAGFVVARLRR